MTHLLLDDPQSQDRSLTTASTTPYNSQSTLGSPFRTPVPASSKAVTRASSRTRHRRPAPSQPPRTTRSRSDDSLTITLDDVEAEKKDLTDEINRLNLSLREIKGDGNCLFRALSDQLWGDQSRHAAVRKLVCDYLEVHEEDFAFWWTPPIGSKVIKTFADYVRNMRQNMTYGTEFEVIAATHVFRRSIRIILPNSSQTIAYAGDAAEPLSSQDLNTPRRRTRSDTIHLLSNPSTLPLASPGYADALIQYVPPIKPGRSMMWLALFSKSVHYKSVRRKGDGETGPADIEDRLAVPHTKDNSTFAKQQRAELVAAGRLTEDGMVVDRRIEAPRSIASPLTDRGESSFAAMTSDVLARLPPHHDIPRGRVEQLLHHLKDPSTVLEKLIDELDDAPVEAMLATRRLSATSTSSVTEASGATAAVHEPVPIMTPLPSDRKRPRDAAEYPYPLSADVKGGEKTPSAVVKRPRGRPRLHVRPSEQGFPLAVET